MLHIQVSLECAVCHLPHTIISSQKSNLSKLHFSTNTLNMYVLFFIITMYVRRLYTCICDTQSLCTCIYMYLCVSVLYDIKLYTIVHISY